MTGLCVEVHAHLAQNKSDLDGMAMRMRDELIKVFIFVIDFAKVYGGEREGLLWWSRCA